MKNLLSEQIKSKARDKYRSDQTSSAFSGEINRELLTINVLRSRKATRNINYALTAYYITILSFTPKKIPRLYTSRQAWYARMHITPSPKFLNVFTLICAASFPRVISF
ncbi:hypothetical protein PUN28_007883 [Cardiocondyla obscurior]|uniref:Uncharacterized protein n=1 Tax=Cardiocondyla obscurior TaxID=286306 RepID=A0AAW2G077_9HYME